MGKFSGGLQPQIGDNIIMKKKMLTGVCSTLLAGAMLFLSACAQKDAGETETRKRRTSALTALTTVPGTTYYPDVTTTGPVTVPETPKALKDIYPSVGGNENLLNISEVIRELKGSEENGNITHAATDGELLVATTSKFTLIGDELEGEGNYDIKRKVYAIRLDLGRIVAEIDFDRSACTIVFLENGDIALVSEPNYVMIVDRNLEKKAEYDVSPFSDSMSYDLKGRIFESTYDGGVLNCHDVYTGKNVPYYAEGLRSFSFIWQEGDEMFFRAYKGETTSVFLSINEKSGDVTYYDDLGEFAPNFGQIISRYREGKWMLARLDDPDRIVGFGKRSSNEYFCYGIGDRFTTTSYVTDENGKSDSTVALYNYTNGDLISEISASACGGVSIYAMGFNDSTDYVPIQLSYTDSLDKCDLLLWMSASENGVKKKCTDYTVYGSDTTSELKKLADEIKKKHGIRVHYDEVSLIGAFGDYDCKPNTDKPGLLDALALLEQCLSLYPDGFFGDICDGTDYNAIEIYLCSGFVPLDSYGIDNAIALTSTKGSSIIMAFDINFSYMLGQNIAHEFMHTMEHRIGDYLSSHGISAVDYWDVANPKDFNYYYSYHDNDGNNVSDKRYTAMDDEHPADAFFYDPYSKTFPTEDRARFFEYMYIEDEQIVSTPAMLEKARRLAALIRAVFPSVAASPELCWESATGIVDIGEFIKNAD